MSKKRKHNTPKTEKHSRPKYNMLQNTAWMISVAWREKEKKVLVLTTLLALLAVARNLTDLYITPTILAAVETQAPLGVLLGTILGFIGLSMLLTGCDTYAGCNYQSGKITVRTAILDYIDNKLATVSYPSLDSPDFQELRNKSFQATNSNRASSEAIWATLRALLTNILGFILYIVLMSGLPPLLLAVILATSALGYFISRPLNEYGYRHRSEEAKITERLWYIDKLANDTKIAKDIRLFGLRPWLNEVHQKASDAYLAFVRKAENVYIWGRIADLGLALVRNGAAYAYLTCLVLNGRLSVSMFLLYFTATGRFTAWVTNILKNFLTLHRQSLDISTIRELLEYPEVFRFEDGMSLSPDPKGSYELKLEHVSFRYPEAEEDTLKDICLTLHPGEKLAVVGLNGAGKTTLVKLLCGFLDPTEGKITLNGRDIREYNRRDYYLLFSAVFQSFSLIAGSVAANVAQSLDIKNIDMDRVKKCVADASLTEKVESLPEAYLTKLNKEVYDDAAMLSGGETQRLMLARALYKDAPIVILDEPTAALDPLAEADMYRKYNQMTQGRSSVYISHRLASTRFCDRIVLISDGRLAEEGTHEELLARRGIYTELFETQSKYYREEAENESYE